MSQGCVARQMHILLYLCDVSTVSVPLIMVSIACANQVTLYKDARHARYLQALSHDYSQCLVFTIKSGQQC